MQSNAGVSTCRIATWLALALTLLVAACTPVRKDVSTSPAGSAAAPAPADLATDDRTAPDDAAARGEGDEDEAGERAPTTVEVLEYGPFPGEELSQAPHDVLDRISPEGDVPLELAPLPPSMPSYDIPMAYNDQVQFWIDFYTVRHREVFEAGLVRSGRYMHVFREIFGEAGLPLDLIHLAHVESGYKTSAYSHAHARGIFQFISGTGRRYGLRIDYWADDRLDPEKSARAAAAYLTDLYDEFGDWYLALAAYNAGEGKIRGARARSGRDDFWGIARTSLIRRETKNYVPAILATVMIAKDPARYGFAYEAEPAVLYESIEVAGAADLQVLARCAGTDLETMKLLNPALRRYQTPPDAVTAVHVPTGSGERTLAELARVPADERVLYVRHRVRGGDTLYALARNYGVSVSAIQQTNHMGRRTTIQVGDELVIPTASMATGERPAVAGNKGAPKKSQGAASSKVHTVRRGETLWRIAALYDTTVELLCSLNQISAQTTLYPGTRLAISMP